MAQTDHQDRLLYLLILALLVGTAATGMVISGVAETLRGFLELQTVPARLLTDFTVAAGEGAALFNAAAVAGIALALVRINGVRLSGPTVAAVFTVLGFGLFGKTPLDAFPILLGTFISAKIAGKRFRDYILIGLFGTALGPLPILIASELALPSVVGWIAGLIGGVVAGMVLPPAAIVMLRLHQGYSLYNIGVTSGFIALFAAALVFGRGDQLPGYLLWNERPSLALIGYVPVLSLGLIVAGLAGGVRNALAGLWSVMKQPGRLPSDFMDSNGVPASLVNMGLLGLLFWGYSLLVGAPMNGPVIGGVLTVVGFAAFGKHLWNVWPVVAGVVLAAVVFGHDLAAPGVILAALFVTTLAPIAGAFGPLVGIIAGFLHLLVVLRSGNWHAGIALYNNGLAGGLTATLLVAVFEWREANRPDRVIARRGSYAAEEGDR